MKKTNLKLIILLCVIMVIISVVLIINFNKKINSYNVSMVNTNYLKQTIDESNNNQKTEGNRTNLKTNIKKLTLSNIINKKEIEVEEADITNLKTKGVIYNNSNIRELSNLSYDELRDILKNSGLEHLSQSFIDAEKKYNVNALFLVSLAALESGWGTSNRAIKYNNLTGMGVSSDDSIGKIYNTQHDCILDTARLLDECYLGEGKIYFKGYSSKDINYYYCAKSDWSDKIDKIASELIDKYNKI